MSSPASTRSDADHRPITGWFVVTGIVMLLLAGLAAVVARNGPAWLLKSKTLHTAATHFPEEITPLVRSGRDVNELLGGRTPLARAVTSGKVDSVRALLNHGADPNLYDPSGATSPAVSRSGVTHRGDPPLSGPLGSAYLNLPNPDDREIIFLLLDAGADPDTKGTFGETMLHKAVRHDDRLLVERLLDVGADVNAQNDRGQTPLHEATAKGHHRLVNRLLDQGADPAIADVFDRTPGDAGAAQQFDEALRDRLQDQSKGSALQSAE
jgi:ankyrin repeat protein